MEKINKTLNFHYRNIFTCLLVFYITVAKKNLMKNINKLKHY